MSKRDEVARIIDPTGEAFLKRDFGNATLNGADINSLALQSWNKTCSKADAIIALLADPDDRMVDAAIYAYMAVNGELRDAIKAAIRAAMKAAGE